MIMFDVNSYLRIYTSRGFDRNCDSKNHGGCVAGCKIDMQACNVYPSHPSPRHRDGYT